MNLGVEGPFMRLGGGWSPYLRVVPVVAAFAVLGAYLVWWGGPQREFLTGQRHELAERELELHAARRSVARRHAVASEIISLEAELSLPPDLAPVRARDGEIGGLLERLDRLATQSSLSLRGYTRTDEQLRGVLTAWPARIELVGMYHDVCVFLDRVSRTPLLVELGSMTMRTVDVAASDHAVRIELTAAAFTYGDSDEWVWVATPRGSAEALSGPCAARGDGSRDPFAHPPVAGDAHGKHAAATEQTKRPGDGAPLNDDITRTERWRPSGLAGVRVNELSLSGVVQSIEGVIAVVRGPQARTYFLRGHERLFDGVVTGVWKDRVVFLQRPADAGNERAPREVVHRLANLGEAGE